MTDTISGELAELEKRLRALADKAERGVSYGFPQTIWRETADALQRLREQVRTLKEYARHDEGCSAALGDQYRCRCGYREIAAAQDEGERK